jgi:hypothetical protein
MRSINPSNKGKRMSYLTDRARAARAAIDTTELQAAPGQRFDDLLLDARVPRRTMLRGGLGASVAALLAACGGGGDGPLESAQAKPGNKFKVGFQPVGESTADAVVVPAGYSVQLLFVAGDAVVPGARRSPAATTMACTSTHCPASTRTRAACWRSTTSSPTSRS